MEERPGHIVLDENTGMLLWQYEDVGYRKIIFDRDYVLNEELSQ